MILEQSNPTELRQALSRGITQFSFKKLDGTLRLAVGTTNLSRIPANNHPQGVRQSSPNVVTFFDIEKSEWRSLNILQEIFIVR
jgi:hypothetical protein